jgi:DNA polymerase-3 subunit delta'
MHHPDLTLIKAETTGGTIKVDQIRELTRVLSLTPFSAKYRLALIIRFEDANQNAANALLKTLEEPPSHVVIILTSESSERLMPTVVSRCELIRLTPVPTDKIHQRLMTDGKMSKDKAELIANLSNGCPGYALSLQQEPSILDLRDMCLEDINQLLSLQYVDRFAYAEKMAKDKINARTTLIVWLSFWRDVMLFAGNNQEIPVNLDWAKEATRLSNQLSLLEAKDLVLSTQRAIDLIERNINPRLILEAFMLDLPYTSMLE